MTELVRAVNEQGLASQRERIAPELDRFARLGKWLAAAEGKDPNGPAGMAAALRLYFADHLGLSPMAASELSIIRGRLFVQAKLLRALAAEHGFRVIPVFESETEATAAVVNEETGEELGRRTFTIEEARQAGLITEGSAWEKWPARMLWARACKFAVDDFIPEVSVGLLTIEEAPEVAEGAAPPPPEPTAASAPSPTEGPGPPQETTGALPTEDAGEPENLREDVPPPWHQAEAMATGARADSYAGRDREERTAEAVERAAQEDAEREREHRRHFATVGRLERDQSPPDGYGSWEEYSRARFEALNPGLHSRGQLDAAGWRQLTEEVEDASLPF